MTITIKVPISNVSSTRKNGIVYERVPVEFLNMMHNVYIKCKNKKTSDIINGVLKKIEGNSVMIQYKGNEVHINVCEYNYYCNELCPNLINIRNMIKYRNRLNHYISIFYKKKQEFDKFKYKFDNLLYDGKIKFL